MNKIFVLVYPDGRGNIRVWVKFIARGKDEILDAFARIIGQRPQKVDIDTENNVVWGVYSDEDVEARLLPADGSLIGYDISDLI